MRANLKYAIILIVTAGLLVPFVALAGAEAPLDNGFLSVRISALNGIGANPLATPRTWVDGFNDAGEFWWPGRYVPYWRGYVQRGDAHLVRSEWQGWQTFGNTSISVTDWYFTFDTIAYTTVTPSDTVKFTTATDSLLQYKWRHYGLLDSTAINSQDGNLVINYLDTHWRDIDNELNEQLTLSAQFEIAMNPTVLGQKLPLTINETTGQYSVAGFWVSNVVAHADPNSKPQGGYVDEPTINFVGNTSYDLLQTTSNTTNVAGKTAYAGTKGGDSAVAASSIEAAITAGNPGADPFAIGISTPSLWKSSTSKHEAMIQPGMPITLTPKAKVTDLTKTTITGNIPFLLQPKTNVYRTTYSYREQSVVSKDNWCLFGCAPTTTGTFDEKNPAYVTLVTTRDVWAGLRTELCVTVATNYTWTPKQPDTPNPGAPHIDGEDGSLDPSPQNHVSNAGGNAGDEGFDWNILIWVIVGICGIAVIYMVYKIKGGGGSNIHVHVARPAKIATG